MDKTGLQVSAVMQGKNNSSNFLIVPQLRQQAVRQAANTCHKVITSIVNITSYYLSLREGSVSTSFLIMRLCLKLNLKQHLPAIFNNYSPELCDDYSSLISTYPSCFEALGFGAVRSPGHSFGKSALGHK